MRVLVTGADGFLGKNLCQQLVDRGNVQLSKFVRGQSLAELPSLVRAVDCVIHLAGVNRPHDITEFTRGNRDLTASLARAIRHAIDKGCQPPVVIFSSSTQAAYDNPYGISKREAEAELGALASSHSVVVHVVRLPNVFGKWCRPDYNSVVATFAHRISRCMEITINDRSAPLTLVYVDDVVERFIALSEGAAADTDSERLDRTIPRYATTVGELAEVLKGFHEGRSSMCIDHTGIGLTRALYATYISYLPTSQFAYDVPQHIDSRGAFVEMLKTKDNGQFSYFTALPEVTRGGHFHHTKTEKFLVLQGQARFRFRHLLTNEYFELVVNGGEGKIVETVPGWTHDVTNIGTELLICMLWANEVFDRAKPDTVARAL